MLLGYQNGKPSVKMVCSLQIKTPKSVLVTQQLTREVESLKKLLQAEAIIDLQKKYPHYSQ